MFDLKSEKQLGKHGKIAPARLKASCIGVLLRIQPGDSSSLQLMMRIGKGEWHEIRCYYCRQDDLPDYADISPDQSFDEDNAEDESNDPEGEEVEEMENADLMQPPPSDTEEDIGEVFEFDLNEILEIHATANEYPGTIHGTQFRGHFLNNAWEIML